MNKSRSICAAVALALFSATSVATPITYNGGVFDITGSLVSGNTYDITYSADLTNFGSNGQNYIDSLAFKVPGGNINNVAPTLESGPVGGVILTNGLDSGGCKGEDITKEWVCLTLASDIATIGNSYEWIFRTTFLTVPLTFDGSSIKMRFVGTSGSATKVGALLSCVTNGQDQQQDLCYSTSVPEPGTLSLLGLGLLGIGAVSRRRRKSESSS